MITFNGLLSEQVYPNFTTDDIVSIVGDDEFDVNIFERIIKLFQRLPDPLPIYRIVAVTDLCFLKTENPGQYWTFDKSKINLHNLKVSIQNTDAYNKTWVLLSGMIDKKDVDWYQTMSSFIEYSLDMPKGYEENEIFIEDTTLIKNITHSILE